MNKTHTRILPFILFTAVFLISQTVFADLKQANARAKNLPAAEAEKAYQEMTQTYPQDAKSWFYYGQFLSGQGRLDEALTNLKKALEIQPGIQYAHLLIAGIYYEQGKYDEALKELLLEEAASPRLGDTHYVRGKIYQQKKDWGNARDSFEKALKKKTRYKVETRAALGTAYANLGDSKNAQRQLEKTLVELDRLSRPAGSYQPAQSRAWDLRAGTLGYYTDNVAGLNDKIERPDTLRSRRDFAWAYYFNGGYKFIDTEHFDFKARYDFYHDVHQRANQYNLLSQAITLDPSLHAGNWSLNSGLAWQHETLGGDPYRYSLIAHPTLSYMWNRFLTALGYKYRNSYYHASPEIVEQERDNVAHSIDMTFYYFPQRWLSMVYLGPEFGTENNDGSDYDHSYFLVRGGFKTKEYKRFTFAADSSFGTAEYKHPNTLALIFLEQKRHSRDFDLALTLAYRIGQTPWQIFTRYNFQRSASNINVYDNTINTVSLGTEVNF